ncbi:hypothetical protein B0A55_05531 [Friedmanniomyces simplex]|uniref:Uncharacterized protein n=1 Tax=Friedmanniomyces simplex TaxID=329884 RepID=A0A4U0XGN4_9PEZI|nr:hypothetical protein B0A55_05531 [Friedmanniomyces simplex]
MSKMNRTSWARPLEPLTHPDSTSPPASPTQASNDRPVITPLSMAANSPAGTNFSPPTQDTSSSRSPTVQCVWEVDDDSSPSGGPLNLTFSRIVGPYGRDRDASTPAAETADLVSILSNATLHDLERIVQGDTEARQQQLLDREMGLLALDERMARAPAPMAVEKAGVGVPKPLPDHFSEQQDLQGDAADTPLPASDEETATSRSERQARQRAAYR